MLKKYLSILLMVLFAAPSLKANPVVPHLFSELLIDSTSWALELDVSWYGRDVKLDTCYLVTNSGRAKIKPCRLINFRFYVITNDSLETELRIDPEGDFLQIVSQNNIVLDTFGFGITPRMGQSICVAGGFYYLDNSPTIGAPNDVAGATGTIRGVFVDSSGVPVSGLTVYWGYEYWPENYLPVDSTGHFSVDVLATTVTIFVEDVAGWQKYDITVYPEDTANVTLIFQKSGNSVEATPSYSVKDFQLFDNYPNPFNNITRIQYQLPRDDFVAVAIFDLTGRLVETLYSGFQEKGKYSLIWDGFDKPSGIYIYQLRTSKFVKNKKCLLIK